MSRTNLFFSFLNNGKINRIVNFFLISLFILAITSCSDTEDNISETTPPTITSSSPSDGDTSVSITSTVSVTFSESMDTSSVTTNTLDTSCFGTFQVSSDGFTTCVQMSSSPTSSNSDKTFTVTPKNNLSYSTVYRIRITTGTKDSSGDSLTSQWTISSGFQTTGVASPILSEVTAVDSETTDTTPSYIFSSTEDGTITYGGSCNSSTTSAYSGNNSITFNTLSDGTYDNCTIVVTDNDNNSSNTLEITTFTIRDLSISSSASDNATVAFGQTYQLQVTTSGTYSGSITYSLSGAPSGMTISSSGLIEWTPTQSSQITTHSNISIRIATASGYIITQTFDLVVTGTCTSGNVLAIWTGDQRTSTNSSNFLGNITAYTDNASDNCGPSNNLDCTPSNNYEYNQTNSSSENLHIGPETSADDGIMFFYNQYDNTSYTYLFWMFGKGGASFSPSPNSVDLDLFVANNESSDYVVVNDDPGANETARQSQTESSGNYTSSYTGRYAYSSGKSDGGVIGPFSGSSYRIFVDRAGSSTIDSETLTLGNLDSFVFWSKDNSSFSLGSVDNFTVGYNTSVDCSN